MSENKEHVLITICARGGSQGIPGKNIKLLNNKPLIAYSIEHAFQLQNALQEAHAIVELSTDSEDIMTVAKRYGLSTNYRRPGHLATDTAGKIDVLHDVLRYSEGAHNCTYDLVIDLDVTAPLRTIDDILGGMRRLKSEPSAVNLFSVSRARRNPYFNMVEKGEDGFFHLVKKGNFVTRQQAPEVYDLNGSFYIYKRLFFNQEYKSAITDRSLIQAVDHICFDLDDAIDFEFMDWLLRNRKLDFNFNY